MDNILFIFWIITGIGLVACLNVALYHESKFTEDLDKEISQKEGERECHQ